MSATSKPGYAEFVKSVLNTPVPTPVARETTGELGGELVGATGPHPATPGGITLAPDDIINRIADRVFEKMSPAGAGGGGGGLPPDPPHKQFLGIDGGGWTRIVLSWTVAILLAVGAWWLTVRDTLKGAASKDHVEERVHKASKAAVDGHEENGAHPKIEQRLESVEIKQTVIRDSQIRQEGTDKLQSQSLDDIKDDLKYIKRQVR